MLLGIGERSQQTYSFIDMNGQSPDERVSDQRAAYWRQLDIQRTHNLCRINLPFMTIVYM